MFVNDLDNILKDVFFFLVEPNEKSLEICFNNSRVNNNMHQMVFATFYLQLLVFLVIVTVCVAASVASAQVTGGFGGHHGGFGGGHGGGYGGYGGYHGGYGGGYRGYGGHRGGNYYGWQTSTSEKLWMGSWRRWTNMLENGGDDEPIVLD